MVSEERLVIELCASREAVAWGRCRVCARHHSKVHLRGGVCVWCRG